MIDNSVEMVSLARKKYPQLFFKVVDITSLPFVNQFDGMLSHAVLRWMKDTASAITSFYRSLRPGERFIAEMVGKGNIQTRRFRVRKPRESLRMDSIGQ